MGDPFHANLMLYSNFQINCIPRRKRSSGTEFMYYRSGAIWVALYFLESGAQGLVTLDQISTFFNIKRHTGHLLIRYHQNNKQLLYADSTQPSTNRCCPVLTHSWAPDLVFYCLSVNNKNLTISCLGLSWNDNRVRDVNKIFSSRIWEFPDYLRIIHQIP